MINIQSSPTSRHAQASAVLFAAVLAGSASTALAADFTLEATDAGGTSSFTTPLTGAAAGWTNGVLVDQAPASGNAYYTGAFRVRTPTAAGDLSFAGDSLAIGGSSGAATGLLQIKSLSTHTLTINNFTINGGGVFWAPDSGSHAATIASNAAITIGGGNGFFAATTNSAQPASTLFVGSTTGAGSLTINPNSGSYGGQSMTGSNINGVVSFGGTVGHSGNTTVTRGTATFADTSTYVFNLADGGVSNQILGAGSANFNGTFSFNLAGVTDATGTWNLVGVGTLVESFGGTFVAKDELNNSFTNDAGVWSLVNDQGAWSFDQSTGALTLAAIPEPSSYAALAGLAMLGLAAARRRRA